MSEQIEKKDVGGRGGEDFADYVAKFAALLATITLPCSVIFDWAYFNRLGLTLAVVPTSLTDHARSAVIWAPFVSLLIVGNFVMDLVDRRGRGWKPKVVDRKKIDSAKNSITRFFYWVLEFPIIGYTLIFALGVIQYVLEGSAIVSTVVMFLYFMWIWLFSWIISSPEGAPSWIDRWRFWLILGPLVVVFAYSGGDSRAADALRQKPTATLYLSSGKVVDNATILRYFDKGVLLKGQNEHLMFVQWSAISNIDDNRPRLIFRGVLCYVFDRCDSSRGLYYEPK
ncbi:hypothetical protein [Burkholderia glumae]|uniref:hypothetical protein n=1 Tax=Burkholderia glumae TaxID=337 RepID=UPI002149D3E4|nr:hypothetical protein [Burkholderia glumae]MCR1769078.1 hypothetical protein [Burkholderia glumae]